MKLIKTCIVILCISLTACCSSKKTSSDNDTSNMKASMTDTEMMEAGFQSGTIVASTKDGDCPYVIKKDGSESVLFDPINIEDSYKKDGMKVWFSYRPLRMMNRCTKANPVELEEMKAR